ncbi:SMI1/KNR4 family protein [Marinicella litoralis]|nr:SMI1/KNR4 family protein [Marinicella litoralis]
MKGLEKINKVISYVLNLNNETQLGAETDIDSINAFFSNLNLTQPEVITQIYLQFNGIDNLNAFFHLNSLERINLIYRINLNLKQDFPNFPWEKSMVPILDINSDIQICIDFNDHSMWAIDLEGSTVTKIANHFDNYLDGLLFSFESQIIKYNQTYGCFEVDELSWQNMLIKFDLKLIGW